MYSVVLQKIRRTLQIESFWQHSALIILFVFLGKSVSLIWKVVLARYGPDTLGLVQVSMVALTLLANFSLFGLQTTVIRFMSMLKEQKQSELAEHIFFFTVRFSFTFVAILVGLTVIFPEQMKNLLQLQFLSNNYIRLLGLSLPAFVGIELLTSYLNVHSKIMAYGVGKYLLQPVFRVVFLFVFLTFSLDIQTTINLHILFSSLVSCVVLAVVSNLWKKVGSLQTPLDPKLREEYFRYSLPVAGSFLLFIFYGSIDTFLLSKYGTLSLVGLFSGLLLLIDLTDMFFVPSLNLLYLHLGKFSHDPKQGTYYVLRKMKIFLSIAVVVFAGIAVTKTPLTHFILGPEYMVAVPFVLPLLFTKLLEHTVIFPLRHLLDFYGYVKQTLFFMSVSLMTKIILGVIFTQQYGILGVILAVSLSNLLHLILCAGATFMLYHHQHNVRSH
jgi:O-antigen/teichoic acid export membrane protein